MSNGAGPVPSVQEALNGLAEKGSDSAVPFMEFMRCLYPVTNADRVLIQLSQISVPSLLQTPAVIEYVQRAAVRREAYDPEEAMIVGQLRAARQQEMRESPGRLSATFYIGRAAIDGLRASLPDDLYNEQLQAFIDTNENPAAHVRVLLMPEELERDLAVRGVPDVVDQVADGAGTLLCYYTEDPRNEEHTFYLPNSNEAAEYAQIFQGLDASQAPREESTAWLRAQVASPTS